MRCYSQLKFEPVTEDKMKYIVSKLNNICARLDIIPMFVFKNIVEQLLPVIAYVCNRSFKLGMFPTDLYVAKVTCVFTSGEWLILETTEPYLYYVFK